MAVLELLSTARAYDMVFDRGPLALIRGRRVVSEHQVSASRLLNPAWTTAVATGRHWGDLR